MPGFLKKSTKCCLALWVLLGVWACGEGPAPDAVADTGLAQVLPSQSRPDVRGVHGAVSAGHPLAAAAGYEVLRRGGNAVDAAVTMAGVLAVVRPHMNGVGGDAFALFYDASTKGVVALNGSGRAGYLATPDFFAEAGAEAAIPQKGALAVSVPGAVAAWADALERFGTISLAEALGPAIQYASEGFPISKRLGTDMEGGASGLNGPASELFLPGGQAPPAGSLLKNQALAGTLRAIASGGKVGFYRGAAARSISQYLETEGGYLREEDFASHTSTWVEPLSSEYEGHTILVLPPNTQGLAQLQLLTMAAEHGLGSQDPASADYLHTLIELKKLAFADRNQWVTDPEFVEIPLGQLLDGEYLTAVDQWGNAVSWIQSLFNTFGSGILEPESGVVLQNRGALFSLDENHPNIVAPGKRPYHTLTPLMALRGDELAFTLGTPGGDSQTQSLAVIINYLLLYGFTPQEAIEAPRFRSYPGLAVSIEDRIPAATILELENRGHLMRVVSGWTATFGGAQMIFVDPETGTLVVASDPRREAYGLAY